MQATQYFAARRLCRSRRITKRPIIFTLLLPLLLLLQNLHLSAQATDPKPIYFSVSFIKIHPDKETQYRELLKKYGKKINEYFYKNGAILGWYMHQVIMPLGAAKEYD